MIKILLPLTLLSSTLGIQASSGAASCPADVKRLAADAATGAPVVVVPDHIMKAIDTRKTEVIIEWLLQNPAVHKDAVTYHEGKTIPLTYLLAHNIAAVELLLDLCPNVLNNPHPDHTIFQRVLSAGDPINIRKITVMMYLQGIRLEDINQQAHDAINTAKKGYMALPMPKQIKSAFVKEKLPIVVNKSKVVFDETAKIRQELGEAAACEEALKSLLLLPLRKIIRTYTTNLPVPKQP